MQSSPVWKNEFWTIDQLGTSGDGAEIRGFIRLNRRLGSAPRGHRSGSTKLPPCDSSPRLRRIWSMPAKRSRLVTYYRLDSVRTASLILRHLCTGWWRDYALIRSSLCACQTRRLKRHLSLPLSLSLSIGSFGLLPGHKKTKKTCQRTM